jgi:hypothetical protein
LGLHSSGNKIKNDFWRVHRFSNAKKEMVKTIPIYVGDTMWDESLQMYRPMSWGDRMRTETLFETKIVPQCLPSGYCRVICLCPKWEGEMQDDPLLDPMVDLLTQMMPEDSAVLITEMAFGPIGQRFTWGERCGQR